DDMVNSLALAAFAARGLGNMSWGILRGSGKGSSSIFYMGSTSS
ncbi:hypothetical protein LCGC14_2821810, partial [marine sediment metagenome]